MEQAEIGLIGLGVMGSNLSLNIAEKGNKIAVFNRSPEATRKFYAEAGELQASLSLARRSKNSLPPSVRRGRSSS